MLSLSSAFDRLHTWYRSQARVSDLTDEWHSLRFSQLKTKELPLRKAMETLYEKAVHIQARLDNIQQPDPLLIEVLRTAVQDEDFSLFIDYNEASVLSTMYECHSKGGKKEV